MERYINNYIKIKDHKIKLNDTLIFKDDMNSDFSEFIKKAYRNFKIGYLKFFKMDKLCRLGFTASEILLKENSLSNINNDEEVGVVLSNANSTIDIDTEYHNTIKDKDNYFPSPSLFVYTLPNILIGEISIRNKFKGENSFFISENFNPHVQFGYISEILNKGNTKAVIGGWVDYTQSGYEAFMYIVENRKTENSIIFNHNNIQTIFNK